MVCCDFSSNATSQGRFSFSFKPVLNICTPKWQSVNCNLTNNYIRRSSFQLECIEWVKVFMGITQNWKRNENASTHKLLLWTSRREDRIRTASLLSLLIMFAKNKNSWVNYLRDAELKFFLNVALLTLDTPYISESCIEIKIKINFIFILLCGGSKGFKKVLRPS